jgi:hypothetical protein
MLDFYKKRSLTLNIAYTSYFNIQYSRRLPEKQRGSDLADAPSPAILSSYFT